MKALLAAVTGLAFTAIVGGAWAQDGANAATETTPAASEPAAGGQLPTLPDTVPPSAAPPSIGAPAAGVPPEGSTAVVAGWEGEVPPAHLGARRTPVGSEALDAFLAQPRLLLDDNPLGGRDMAQSVRSLVGTDNRTVITLVNLVKMPDVRDAQVGAVAEGLAGAMRDAEVPAPRYAAYIQWAVAQSGSKELIEAFERASGAEDDRTAAIGSPGARGGAPGSGSLSGGGAPGVSGPVGSNSTVSAGGVTGGSVGRGGVSFSESGRLLNGATGRLVVCTLDASPAGCQVVF